MRNYIIAGFFLFLFLQIQAQDWRPLFNGKNLDGWEIHSGMATYDVEDGTIVGKAVLNSPNTFLCTKERFSDFILEFEVFLPNNLNSGVQFRSHIKENDRVYGYQCEIDPDGSRAWTGGIYDEANRGWLYPLTRNEKARKAFQLGRWVPIRIECLGSDIRTYVDGTHTSWLIDDGSGEGLIGLQVHSIEKEQERFVVKWRNIRILTGDIEQHRYPADPVVPQISYLKNELTAWEKSKGFTLLWDGKTTEGWQSAKGPGFPEWGWTIENGILSLAETGGGESTGPGDIVTTKNYSNFELELEFKFAEGANSGIKYFADTTLKKGPGSEIGSEFQILDDERHPDAKMGVQGNRTLGSLYDLIPKKVSNKGRLKGSGVWQKARIISKDGNVEHWLNNEKVVEYDRFSQMFEALVNSSKYKEWENFGRWPEGFILLQDHGNQVHFRSIKIREF